MLSDTILPELLYFAMDLALGGADLIDGSGFNNDKRCGYLRLTSLLYDSDDKNHHEPYAFIPCYIKIHTRAIYLQYKGKDDQTQKNLRNTWFHPLHDFTKNLIPVEFVEVFVKILRIKELGDQFLIDLS